MYVIVHPMNENLARKCCMKAFVFTDEGRKQKKNLLSFHACVHSELRGILSEAKRNL